ncbi:glycoside hydrolase superfamily [Leucosporidium creatinivorum]|uniref:Glycoside hydrolase superfamily n=1 Tax=Leucosporidium creatinivorum TaxID=106004 RepID=A0A1Y2EGS5_9BASI|nr:glycoside hydrolase superfamily [Leucosporidium creatinivorum]
MVSFTNTLLALPLLATAASAACNAKHTSSHRRHHSKQAASSSSSSGNGANVLAASQPAATASRSANNAFGGSSSTSSYKSSSSSSYKASSTASSTASASSSTSTSSIGWGLTGMKKNQIAFGWLPDDGSGGGTSQTISEIVSAMGQQTSAQGWYAQAQSGTLFDGGQLTSRMDQIVTGGVFQPAVMPTGGWWGLTADDNQQAVAICKVMKQFTDKGVEVWLRFAHEVNYYQEDGTYQGDANDFKAGWAAVSAACKEYAPEVKMWYTPNVASEDQYDEYYPDDPSTVDLIGIDYYPKETSGYDFVGTMKTFHDRYTSSDGPHFAIGEIGNGVTTTMSQRLAWLQDITSTATKTAMPNFIACSWFNYHKGYDFRIAAVDGDSVIKSYFAA